MGGHEVPAQAVTDLRAVEQELVVVQVGLPHLATVQDRGPIGVVEHRLPGVLDDHDPMVGEALDPEERGRLEVRVDRGVPPEDVAVVGVQAPELPLLRAPPEGQDLGRARVLQALDVPDLDDGLVQLLDDFIDVHRDLHSRGASSTKLVRMVVIETTVSSSRNWRSNHSPTPG